MDYSPILSIITALFEICVVIWALRGPGRKSIIYTSSALLLLLAAYQVLEVIICEFPQGNMFMSRLAFIVITWLPPVCILLIAHLYPSKARAVYRFSGLMFGLALLIILWIILDKNFVSESVCTIVFARYSNPMPAYIIYSVFYQAGLLGMLLIAAYGVIICRDHKQRRLLGQVLIGSLAFFVPSLITVIAIPYTSGALPSIMCHYALLLAIFIIRLIYLERRLNPDNA